MEDRKRFYSSNMFRVCIDTYRTDIRGRAYSPLYEGEIKFHGIGQLLVKMDKLFDRIGYPQAFQNKRSFGGERNTGNAYRGVPENVRDTEDILRQMGEHCTYDVAVESRRNTSWQGIIFDSEGNEQGRFDGEVELLAKLIELAEKKV